MFEGLGFRVSSLGSRLHGLCSRGVRIEDGEIGVGDLWCRVGRLFTSRLKASTSPFSTASFKFNNNRQNQLS